MSYFLTLSLPFTGDSGWGRTGYLIVVVSIRLHHQQSAGESAQLHRRSSSAEQLRRLEKVVRRDELCPAGSVEEAVGVREREQSASRRQPRRQKVR